MSEKELIKAIKNIVEVYINDGLTDEETSNELILYYVIKMYGDACRYEAIKKGNM